jgi:hypothetical protein
MSGAERMRFELIADLVLPDKIYELTSAVISNTEWSVRVVVVAGSRDRWFTFVRNNLYEELPVGITCIA